MIYINIYIIQDMYVIICIYYINIYYIYIYIYIYYIKKYMAYDSQKVDVC